MYRTKYSIININVHFLILNIIAKKLKETLTHLTLKINSDLMTEYEIKVIFAVTTEVVVSNNIFCF